jgi:hypothetical protein
MFYNHHQHPSYFLGLNYCGHNRNKLVVKGEEEEKEEEEEIGKTNTWFLQRSTSAIESTTILKHNLPAD